MLETNQVLKLDWTVCKKFRSLSYCWQDKKIPLAGRQRTKALCAHCTFPRAK